MAVVGQNGTLHGWGEIKGICELNALSEPGYVLLSI